MDEKTTEADSSVTENAPRKRGRPAATHPSKLIKVTLSLDKDDTDWGRERPGGLSALMRRLLKEEKARQEAGGSR